MRAHVHRTRWGVPLGMTLVASGLMLFWIAIVATNRLPRMALMIAAVGAGAGAIVSLAVSGIHALRQRRRQQDRELAHYACPRCDYRPTTADIERGESYPCPACGQPVYSHTK